MNIFNDHKKLYITAGLLFLLLTFFTAIQPALKNQKAKTAEITSSALLDCSNLQFTVPLYDSL